MREAYRHRRDPSLRGSVRRRAAALLHRKAAARSLPEPVACFAFDDVPLSAAVEGAAILERAGQRGTFYVCGGLTGQSEGELAPYADWDVLRALADRGHEIGCHGYAHLNHGLAADAEALRDIDDNNAAFHRHGLPAPTTFAYPFGEVSGGAKRRLAARYRFLRATRKGLLARGTDLANIPAVPIEGDAAAATARTWLQRAQEASAGIIFFSHDVMERPSPWGVRPAILQEIVAETVARGFQVMTVAECCALLIGQERVAG